LWWRFIVSSPATAGFALNALLDAVASVVLVWRFRLESTDPEAAEHSERRAQRAIIAAMFAIAAYISFGALRVLIERSHAEESVLAVLLAGVSVLFLPWLGRAKLVTARRLESPALRGDATLTLAGAALAGLTLVALLLNAGLGWWWADPVAALAIAVGLGVEATRVAVRHTFG